MVVNEGQIIGSKHHGKKEQFIFILDKHLILLRISSSITQCLRMFMNLRELKYPAKHPISYLFTSSNCNMIFK